MLIRRCACRASVVALILVVAVLAVCLIESAEAFAAEHHGCAALVTERAGTSSLTAKALSGVGWAIPAQVSLPSAAGWPGELAPPDDTRRIPSARLASQFSPRSPPISL